MSSCKAIIQTGTKKGEQCKCKVKPNSEYCGRHINSDISKYYKTNSEIIVPSISPSQEKTTLKTEDTGKIFEMAICLAFNIEYVGNYKYSLKEAELLKDRIHSIVNELYTDMVHTGNNHGRYDFTSKDNETKLSAKSTKKGVGKVAPQVIGQCSLKKFCEIIDIDELSSSKLKQYIQENITRILVFLEHFTFDCNTLYYNKEDNTIQHIRPNNPIEWTNTKYSYMWTKSHKDWRNSSTLKICYENQSIPILEIQFHSKSRKNMAIRWYYKNILSVFASNFTITYA